MNDVRGQHFDGDNEGNEFVQDPNLRTARTNLRCTSPVHAIIAARVVTIPLKATFLNENYRGASSKEGPIQLEHTCGGAAPLFSRGLSNFTLMQSRHVRGYDHKRIKNV